MYNIDEIKKDAEWCLNCKNRPCVLEGCPMDTNIPEFITEIKNDNYKEAYDILRKNNIFSHMQKIHTTQHFLRNTSISSPCFIHIHKCRELKSRRPQYIRLYHQILPPKHRVHQYLNNVLDVFCHLPQ